MSDMDQWLLAFCAAVVCYCFYKVGYLKGQIDEMTKKPAKEYDEINQDRK